MQSLSWLQLKLLGIGVEVSLEVGDGHAVGVLVVYTQSATHVDVLYADAMTDKLLLQFVHAIAQSLEVAHIQYLRSDVEVQTHKLHVLHLFGFAYHRHHIAHGDTKLVLGQSGGDVGVSVCAYVWIQTESHTSHLALSSSKFVDNL